MTLFEAVRGAMRRLHRSPRTEEAYLHWIRELIRFHDGKHPRQMTADDITAFLNDLAVRRRTAASTQNQALCAIVFLYKSVLDQEMGHLAGLQRARRPEHLPTVLSRADVLAVIERLSPPFRLIAEILYGSGLRLMECLSLRVKDIDLERQQISEIAGGAPAKRKVTPKSSSAQHFVRLPGSPAGRRERLPWRADMVRSRDNSLERGATRRTVLCAALAAGAAAALLGAHRAMSGGGTERSGVMGQSTQSSRSTRMPVGFVAHGAPTMALDAGKGADLSRWARRMQAPAAYLMISAHWQDTPIQLSSTQPTELVYDFYGFPDELYRVRHDAPAASWLADRIEAILGSGQVRRSARGLDHGAWTPLRHFDPEARVPVLQVSMPQTMSPSELVAMGRSLAPLRDEGVFLLGSGNLTHNLRRLDFSDRRGPDAWAVEFDTWVEEALRRGDVDALADMDARAPAARLAHPTDEHYRPLLVALGAAGDDLKRLDFPVTGFEFANLTRRSVQMG
jgi:4,5-DOPA dioxygenase extradiol